MTDNEIIHALINYAEKETTESSRRLIFDALDLMGRLIVERDKANLEIYKLENSLAISKKETKRYAARRAEAIKEFAERLKDTKFKHGNDYIIYAENIDNLVKEMIGENK